MGSCCSKKYCQLVNVPYRIKTHYQVETINWKKGALIGKGAYGKVFECLNLYTGELHAVKYIALNGSPDQVMQEVTQLKQKISTFQSFHHENIIKYLHTEIDKDFKGVNIFMEYATGGSFRQLLKKLGKFEENMTASYLIQIMKALSYIHSLGVVHRDIKSANILVGQGKTIKLSDFGASRKIDFESCKAELCRSLKGSPYWMAPEVAKCVGHSFSADIWSVGCLAIEMLTGSAPWSDKTRSAKEVIGLLARGEKPNVPQNISSNCFQFISACLEINPDSRPSASELLEYEFLTQLKVNSDRVLNKREYRLISKKGEGTFSEVLKAQSIKTGKYVAIKCMKNYFSSLEQVNNLREIQALRRLSPNAHIIKFIEILYDEPTGRLALVFELMDLNLYEWMRSYKTEIPEYKVKSFIYQILKALDHMHRNGIFHRDIKPENVLIAEDTIKLADFGSCRGVYSKQPYTEYISTRWYRPPECLLTDGYYGAKMDLWGVGCVFYELLTTNPLFPGENEYDQISLIHNVLGTPGVEVLTDFEKKTKSIKIDFTPVKGTGLDDLFPSNVSEHAKDLIKKLLVYKAEDRITTKQALKHPYFKEFRKMESPSRNSPSPHSLRSFDADRAAGDEERGDLKLPLIKTNVKKLTDAQHNPSKASLIEKTSYQTKKAIQDNKKKYAIPKKKLYKSIF